MLILVLLVYNIIKESFCIGSDFMDKLDELIVKIYEIIPAYYDEKEAIEIKKLILDYIKEECNK